MVTGVSGPRADVPEPPTLSPEGVGGSSCSTTEMFEGAGKLIGMEELSLGWQIVLTVAPSIATPVITGALTIWGVVIAANRADKRRITDQTKEDQRRKDDLDDRERERKDQLINASNDRQRNAVGDFLASVRASDIAMELKLNETIISPQRDQSLPYMMNQVRKYARQRGIYAQCYQELDKAWQLLDLEVTHPEIRKVIMPIKEAIDSFSLEYSRYSRQCGEHAQSVMNYMTRCGDDGREVDLFKDFPGPSFTPRLVPVSAPLLEQLRRMARKYLNLLPD